MSDLTIHDVDTTADIESIAGLITELVTYMAGQAPGSIHDAMALDACGVDERFIGHIIGGIHRSFGVQVPRSQFRHDIGTIGRLSQVLGAFVYDTLRARTPGPDSRAASPSETPSSVGLGAGYSPVAAPRLLFVGIAGASEFQHALARRGKRATALTYYDPAPGAGLPIGVNGVIDHVEAVDWAQPLDIVRRIVEHRAAAHIEGVIPVTEFGLLPAALATTQLGIPGPSLRAVRNTRDKWQMRRTLEQAGLGQVRYATCRTPAAAKEFLARVGGPIILKPVSGTGSEGVSLITNDDELDAAFDVATRAAGFTGILCEEYCDGPEVSLEGYSVDGRFVPVALTDKLTDDRFLEIGHQQPSAHPESVSEAAADIAGRALRALGITNGVTHTELRITTRGPVLIETHTRMGGDFIHVLTKLTTGVDLTDLMVAFSLGETVDVKPVPQGCAAAIRFLVGRPGRVSGVKAPVVQPGSGVYAIASPNIGRVVSGRSASRERLGHVIATGPTPELAGKTAESCLAQFHVDYFNPRDLQGVGAP